ncbi:tumor necrosis factor receptor superfamily member 5 [Nematolebias whitei]|uniref:tumor necrosis factor receptor superfamily member 5 n=1 Tax=Nematolebias whitei TaxID=451745 RepID=UPI0018990F0C|nr:tumor necrosis factor receptor superfamily member 5 [Nematolebias whitei]
MTTMNCSTLLDHKDGRCCDRCPAGQYVQTPCNSTQKTKCGDCQHGSHTATENFLTKCLPCKKCNHTNGRTVTYCTAKEDTICGCESGFYCSNENCDHCQPLTRCPLGEGVTIKASRTSDLKCSPCEDGTYSNFTDFSSQCFPHTRCENFGRELKTPGTRTTDSVCGNFNTYCPWMLPAGLWAGLVLTIIVFAAAFIFWRAKHKSCRTASLGVPVTHVETDPAPAVSPPELTSHCQETCIHNDCKLRLFNSDDPQTDCSTGDSLDTRFPITPLKASVSFVECSHTNGYTNYSTTNICRSYSEPQEDEWCGMG